MGAKGFVGTLPEVSGLPQTAGLGVPNGGDGHADDSGEFNLRHPGAATPASERHGQDTLSFYGRSARHGWDKEHVAERLG